MTLDIYVASFFGCYCTGWCLGFGILFFKQLFEKI